MGRYGCEKPIKTQQHESPQFAVLFISCPSIESTIQSTRSMLIFVYGEDQFRSQEKVLQLKNAFKAKHDPTGLNTVDFPIEGSKLNVGEVLQAVSTLPFLAKRRMVIIRDLLSTIKKDEIPIWKNGLSRIPESTIVILWDTIECEKVQKNKLFEVLQTVVDLHSYPFPSLVGSKLTQWIVERVKAKNVLIEDAAIRSLIERVSTDAWQMAHEVDKLIAFSNGKTITESMVDQLVNSSFEGKIFELVDALSKKDVRTTVRLLQEERFAGSDDYYLLSMFARQIRLLLSAWSVLDKNPKAEKNQIATELDIHPFVASKLIIQAKNFSKKMLIDAHETLYMFDREIKHGNIDVNLAVDLMTINLLKK